MFKLGLFRLNKYRLEVVSLVCTLTQKNYAFQGYFSLMLQICTQYVERIFLRKNYCVINKEYSNSILEYKIEKQFS